ncbi:MAG: SGNH/GDSL hydrolase family protein [Gammaproteobacteria bacterium]
MARWPHRLKIAGLMLAIIWPGPGSATAMFDELVVIGDSLSDQGNVFTITGGMIPPPEYNSGRFTNGLNYIDFLAPSLGLSATPSEIGGSNYAYGGARMDFHALARFGALSLLEQKNAYISALGGAPANPNALHVVWAGSNDLFDIISTVATDPTYDPTADITSTVEDLALVVGSLATVGARDILFPNVPNLGIVPRVTAFNAGNPVDEATKLAALFNAAVAGALDDILASFPALNIVEFDVFTLTTELFIDPLAFGFINATDACYSEFVVPGGTVCANPDEYVSWDGFHPTTATHEQIAARMRAQLVPEPSILALMVIGLTGMGVARRRMKA